MWTLFSKSAGIPNTNDSAFNSGDLNASAIDRKFYTMALMLDDVKQGVTTLIKHRWANFFSRINLVSPTKYNIDDLNINIGTNLPSMTDETINQQLALNGILSQKTLLSNLGYDYATEKRNKEEEAASGMTSNPDNLQQTASNSTDTDTTDTTATTTADTDEGPSEKTSTVSTTSSQTNNQIEAKTQNKSQPVKDKTKNIKKTQTREGRPNK